MQTIIKGGPTDLIAYAWFRMGYRPRESVVLVGLHRPHRRSGVVARCDLPPPAQRRAALAQLMGLLRRGGDDELVALVVSDVRADASSGGTVRAGRGRAGRAGADRDGVALPHRALVKELRAQARSAGIVVIDVLAVGEDSYRSYLCRDTSCCPPGGLPLSEVMGSQTAAHMVLNGMVLADGEADVIADVLPDPDVDGSDDVGLCAPDGGLNDDGLDDDDPDGDDPDGDDPDGDGAFTPRQRVDMLEAWRELVRVPDTGRRVLWLALALEDPLFRDVVILTLVSAPVPSAEVPHRDLARAMLLADGRGFDAELGRLLSDAEPDDAWLERGRVVLSAVARRAPAGCRAGALSVLAWAAWWAGHGARARLLAREALTDQPDHRLAWLVDQMLAAAIPPPWVLRAVG